MGFIEDDNDSAPAAYRAVAGDFLDLQALDGHGNVVLGDVVRGGLVGAVAKNVRRQTCGQESREVEAVVGVDARLKRTTDTRQRASTPSTSLGRSR